MSESLSTLLREGELRDGDRELHDEDPSLYTDMFEQLRADGQMPSGDIDPGLGSSSNTLDNDNLNNLSARAGSERQHSIPIPPSLAGIASQVKPLDLNFEDPLDSIAFDVVQDDRGEMGGKRKKPLAERAGWKDMDANGNMPKRPRGKRGFKDNDSFIGYQPANLALRQSESRRDDGQGDGITEEAANTLARDLAEAGREMGLEHGVLADALRQSEDQLAREDSDQPGAGPVDDRNVKPSTESRAEQNRRAQQVYRRRREERIKELEASAAALEPTRRALSESHQKLKSIAVEYESTKIQLSALQSTLLALNKQGVSILTTQYNFPMDSNNLKETETMRPGPIGQSDVEKAFEQLERQSKELALSRQAD